MKGYAMLKIGESGWIEKERPKCGPMDAICRPLAVAICTSDVHTLWEGAIGDRHNMILGHECCAEVVEVGELVKDFKPGDRVLVPAITPDWNSLEAQAGYSMHSGGMLAGWKFSNFKDGVFSEFFHVNDADGNLALLPKNINVVDACMLSDMVPTGFHGVELADVQFGDTVLVIGIGPVGLMSVAGTNMRGASRIIAVGTRPVCVEAAKKYGDQCVVLSIDAKRAGGRYEVYAKGGRVPTGIDAVEWAYRGQEEGAGEIVLNSIDTDGVKGGFDLEMLSAVCAKVRIPVIASGGAGKAEDFVELFRKVPGADAGLAASIFHFGEVDIRALKRMLAAEGIPVRL